MKKIIFLFVACLTSSFSFSQISINEIDADQTSTDVEEFIELSTPAPNTALDGYVVVLYNGSDDESYDAFDLDGYTTDANGFLLLASDGFPGQDISLGPDNGLQNGEDAVAIYQADATDFPSGTLATSANLIDALVYGTGDPEDTGLLSALGETVQYDEDVNGLKDVESIQSDGSGAYCVGAPTPDAANIDCGNVCPLIILNTNVACDNITSGTDTYTVSLGFEGGNTETYTITASSGTVGGEDPSSSANGTITISGISEGTDLTYTISSTLCSISENITSPACEPSTPVSNIAALRSGTVGEKYTLTQEVLLTFQQDFRNQKYIEDATGAILIDDASGIITTPYAIGDGITGITGTLSEFNDILQFVPENDPGSPSSTGNTLTPQTVTLTQLTNNPGDYDAELVKVLSATVTTTDNNITTWVVGTIYPMATTDGAFNFRTSFYDADYIGQDLPGDLVDITGIINRNDTDGDNTAEYFLTARNAAGIETLGIQENSLVTIKIYPNPSRGSVTIETVSNEPMNVKIYNLLGEKVLDEKQVNGTLSLNNLKTGIYLIKILQDGKAVTKKLVVN